MPRIGPRRLRPIRRSSSSTATAPFACGRPCRLAFGLTNTTTRSRRLRRSLRASPATSSTRAVCRSPARRLVARKRARRTAWRNARRAEPSHMLAAFVCGRVTKNVSRASPWMRDTVGGAGSALARDEARGRPARHCRPTPCTDRILRWPDSRTVRSSVACEHAHPSGLPAQRPRNARRPSARQLGLCPSVTRAVAAERERNRAFPSTARQ